MSNYTPTSCIRNSGLNTTAICSFYDYPVVDQPLVADQHLTDVDPPFVLDLLIPRSYMSTVVRGMLYPCIQLLTMTISTCVVELVNSFHQIQTIIWII